jgi:hypothetical protein
LYLLANNDIIRYNSQILTQKYTIECLPNNRAKQIELDINAGFRFLGKVVILHRSMQSPINQFYMQNRQHLIIDILFLFSIPYSIQNTLCMHVFAAFIPHLTFVNEQSFSFSYTLYIIFHLIFCRAMFTIKFYLLYRI